MLLVMLAGKRRPHTLTMAPCFIAIGMLMAALWVMEYLPNVVQYITTRLP